MKRKVNLAILFTTLFFSCTYEKNNTFPNGCEFPRQDTVLSKIIVPNLEMSYPRQVFVLDTLIGVVDLSPAKDYIQLYSSHGQFLTSIGAKGKGPGEIFEFKECFFDEKGKTVSVFQRNKIIVYDLNAVLNKKIPYFKETSVLKQNESAPKNITMLENGNLFKIGQTADFRFAVQTKDENVIFEDYPEITDTKEEDAAIWRYAHTFSFDKNRTRFVQGSYIGAVLDYYSISGNKITPLQCVRIYKPVFKILQANPLSIMWDDETTIGFESIDCTNKYVYTLLNGRKGKELKEATFDNPPFADCISVFDWEGNPVKSINHGNKMLVICVKDDKTLYAVVYKNGRYSLAEIKI